MGFLIKIAERLLPFTHLAGACCPIPRTHYAVQVFPTRIRLYDLASSQGKPLGEIAWDLRGPLKDFTVQLDLEKGQVSVWGTAQEGYLRYRICRQQGGIFLSMERAPKEGVSYSYVDAMNEIAQECSSSRLLPGQKIALVAESQSMIAANHWERLSLGGHKKQDWELVARRQDPVEILPVWYALGQQIPQISHANPLSGCGALLESCRHAVANAPPEHLLKYFLELFQVGFIGLMTPQTEDSCFRGIVPSPLDEWFCPLILLSEGTKLLRSLLIEQKGNVLSLLPRLPPELHCGRMLGVHLPGIGRMDLEWTKKRVRRFLIHADHEVKMVLNLKGHVKSFRVRKENQKGGAILESGSEIFLIPKTTYQLDKFEY